MAIKASDLKDVITPKHMTKQEKAELIAECNRRVLRDRDSLVFESKWVGSVFVQRIKLDDGGGDDGKTAV